MSDKQYFSLAIDKDAKKQLDVLTAKYTLNQTEVIEVLLGAASRLSDLLENDFDAKKETKDENRNEIRAKKSMLRKAMAKMSPDEMEAILRSKGLLNTQLDLGQSAVTLESLTEYLSAYGRLRAWHEAEGKPLRVAKTDCEIILECGRPMLERHLLSENVTNPKSRQCYSNAWAFKNRRKAQNLRYCEGYVLVESCPIPVHHGWCLNAANEVVDPSVLQHEQAIYYGVEYHHDFAKTAWQALEKKHLIGIMLNMYALKHVGITSEHFLSGLVTQ